MLEAYIAIAMGELRFQSEQRQHLQRRKEIEEARSPDELDRVIARHRAEDEYVLVERRHREHLQAIRDSAPKVTVNVWS